MSDFLGVSNLMAPSQPLMSQTRASKGAANQETALDQACRDFESVFINYMLQQMRRTIPQDGLFNGGQAEQIYTSMLDSETARSISNQRGLGLADLLRHQLSAQEPLKKK